MNKKITNAVIFQVGWFVCILLDVSAVIVFSAVALTVHFYYIVEPTRRLFEACFIVIVLSIGTVIEVAYLLGDVLVTEYGGWLPSIWLLMLWVLFATTLNHSLSWLISKPYLAGLLTAVAAPWSYYAGVHLREGIDFGLPPMLSLAIIGLSWSVLMVAVYQYLAKRLLRCASNH